jgi:hypothetical protein
VERRKNVSGSLWLLAAAWVAAGQQFAPVEAAPGQPIIIPMTSTEAGPGMRPGRLRDFFRGRRDAVYYTVTPGPATALSGGVTTAEPPRLQPDPTQTAPALAPATAEQTVTALKPVPEVDKAHQDKVGAAEDYSWITGQLFYVRAGGGLWVLRYGSVGQVDKYGGSVVLAPGADMKNYREGDVVCVNGQVLSEGRASRQLGGPPYRVTSIQMIDRADR